MCSWIVLTRRTHLHHISIFLRFFFGNLCFKNPRRERRLMEIGVQRCRRLRTGGGGGSCWHPFRCSAVPAFRPHAQAGAFAVRSPEVPRCGSRTKVCITCALVHAVPTQRSPCSPGPKHKVQHGSAMKARSISMKCWDRIVQARGSIGSKM